MDEAVEVVSESVEVEMSKESVDVAESGVEAAIKIGAEAVTVKIIGIPSPSKSLPTAEGKSVSLGLFPSTEQRKRTVRYSPGGRFILLKSAEVTEDG